MLSGKLHVPRLTILLVDVLLSSFYFLVLNRRSFRSVHFFSLYLQDIYITPKTRIIMLKNVRECQDGGGDSHTLQ
jgi:hypothetical protein